MDVKIINIVLCIITGSLYATTFEKITYFAIEHPKIDYVNTKHMSFVKTSAKRYSRNDPVYYFNMHYYFNYDLDNNYTISFYFYNEVLPHVYKRTYVEFSMKLCDFVNKEQIFGAAVKRAFKASYPDVKCPFPKGEYNLQNMTLNAAVLPDFAYKKGRIQLNITYGTNNELITGGYVDFQVKQMKVKKN